MTQVLSVMVLVLIVVVPVALGIVLWRRRIEERLLRSATVTLHVDGFGVRRELADGREESVDWNELTEVEVYRTTSGPHAAAGGLLMLAADATRGCLVPLDKIGAEGLVEGLSRLPGFDIGRLHEAVATDPPAQISVWRRGS